ncbi:MAG: hypothetical protein HQL16_01085 [Candidatus Omnitrophica bacterium]|nr:hypothetical protein [Candidatus Omnitrophota bacterium]
MKTIAVQKESVGAYKNRFTQNRGFPAVKKGESECILFCKRVTPNIFDIKDGFAVISGAEDCFNDGVCMISDFTKVVFVFGRGHEEK